jgi:outer membrane protein TolC
MRRQSPLPIIAVIAAGFVILAGCQPQQPFYFHEDKDLSHYKGMATEIEYPDVESCTLSDVQGAVRPFSLLNNQPKEVWDLTLEEAIRNALTNNKIMRSIGGQVQGPPDFIARNQLVPSIYDPALQESNPRSGVEAALSAFDVQFGNKLYWNKTENPSITFFPPFGIQALIQQQDTASFQSQLQKTAATGGTFTIQHNVNYNLTNDVLSSGHIPIPTNWNVNLTAGIRQPLLRGAGLGFNRIAGPGAQPGLYNGVVLARINTDIALADFEASVRNLVADVETAYWELYFNYRSLDAVIAGRESALQTWRKVYALFKLGAKGGEADKEAQARENYFLFRTSVEQALSALYDTEAKLRYLMGIAATDGRLIRPIDEPTTAKITFDWYDAQCEALARSVELRQQKWVVKRRELELAASKNFLLPQLDAVGQYTWLGTGNQLIASSGGSGNIFDFEKGIDVNAYQSMTSGRFQGWQMGLEFSMPLGFRREMSGVRNAQLQLAKERAKLQESELELSHQLAFAIRDMEAAQVLSQTNFNRRIAAQRQVDAVAAAYNTGTITFDVLLQSQQRLAQAESDYFRSVVNYNRAIMQVHYRKGSLLEYNGICLAEGPWPGKAYFDAQRRARARDAGTYLDYGFTQPRVLSQGPYEQHEGTSTGVPSEGAQGAKAADPELVPTPEPQPADPGSQPASPAPAMPEEPQPAPDAGASAGNPPASASSTIKITSDAAPAASQWKSAPKTASRTAARAAYTSQKSSFTTDAGATRLVSASSADSRPVAAPEQEGQAGFAAASDRSTAAAYEPGTDPSTVEANRPASGWKRISR